MTTSKRLTWAITWLLVTAVIAGVLSALYLSFYYQVQPFRGHVHFKRPWALLLLVSAVLTWIARTLIQRFARPRLQFSRATAQALHRETWRTRIADLPGALRTTAISLIVIGLMGPQSIHAGNTAEFKGIEIILTLDMSRSMEATDIRPTRFQASKTVMQNFINRRPNDRIGAVVFGRDAYTLMPLTIDHQALLSALSELQINQIDGRGTAIGNAIGVSLNRLKHSDAKSKVIILLTDGESNSGNISPRQAAELANATNVKIFPILIGVSEEASAMQGQNLIGQVFGERQVEYPVNPELLQEIAQTTQGEFFAVNDRKGLEHSFHEILDRLQKTDIEDAGQVSTELFPAFVMPAFLLLLFELLCMLWLRRWP